MSVIIWFIVLIIAAFAAHWGAEHLAKPLHKLVGQWGLTAVAGGAMLALFTAGSEFLISVTSAVRGVSGIGLGMVLGSSIIHVPAIVTVAYFATRQRRLGKDGQEEMVEDEEKPEQHKRHLDQHLLRVRKEAVSVLVLPYLALVILIGIVTLPEAWRGLQPIDGLILSLAYLVYLGQALMRGRGEGEKQEWSRKEIGMAVAGVVVMALGAYTMVRSTENIASSLGISEVVAGLFITAVAGSGAEWFSSWKVARTGQVTEATTVVIGDHAVTLTLGLLPLALVTMPIDNLPLYVVSLVFVGLIPAFYGIFIRWGPEEAGFQRWQVFALDGLYIVYVAIVLFSILNLLE